MNKNPFELGTVKWEVARSSANRNQFYREDVEAKQEVYLIGWSLSAVILFSKAELAVCDWLSLGFDFLTVGIYRLRFWVACIEC